MAIFRRAAAWNEDDVLALFEAEDAIAAVAYPLRASNRYMMWTQFQDLEYMTAGYMKIAQVMIEPGRASEVTLAAR